MHLNIFILTIIFSLTAACSSVNNASEITQKYNFKYEAIKTNLFTISAFTKVRATSKDIHIYIEGDGLAWRTRSTPSNNPTPRNQMFASMASLDTANTIYLARPCQYIDLKTEPNCTHKYWTSHRFAPEIVSAMNNVISQMKHKYKFANIHLIGFSGGGALTALLAAQRNDIATIRTIAGNLDHILLNKTHNVSKLSGSLNPIDIAKNISHIPQYHFIGGKDKVVFPSIIKSYMNASINTSCINTEIIPNASHTKGWLEIWSKLLKRPINCKN